MASAVCTRAGRADITPSRRIGGAPALARCAKGARMKQFGGAAAGQASSPQNDRERGTRVAEETTANAAQREYWNNVAGPRWVGLEGFVERRVRAVNDLLLRHLGAKAGEIALEIGCGTGAFTVPLAEAVGEHGAVVGADISRAMLDGARRRLTETGLRNISLIEADAQIHKFEPGRFDLIASRFGVMFFADPAAAFANLIDAARPAGRLCFACWGSLADNRHWLIPYELALRRLGSPEPQPPRAPGPMAFADPDYVRAFLGTAGFVDVAIDREHPEMFASAPAGEAEFACLMGPVARLIDEKQPDEATRRLIRLEIEEAFADCFKSGNATLSSTVLLVSALRP
jgi:SAM-dependent methyltransferase